MSFSTGPVFTAAGRALHARAIAGDTLTFTKMQMGDGDLGSSSIEGLTALVRQVGSVNISALRYSGNFARISGVFTNADTKTGFYWKEIGLFAADPDHPNDRTKDILYCYQNAGSLAEYIPAAGSDLITKRITIAAIVSNASTVTAALESVTEAEDVGFDSASSGLTAGNVQAALIELAQKDVKPEQITQAVTSGVSAHNTAADAHKELFAKKADLVNGKVPVSQLDSVTILRTATLTVAGWTIGTDGRYSQTVAVDGIKADTPLVIVDCNLTTNDADAKVAFLEAWAGPSANEVAQGAGTLTFYSHTLPAVSIPIFVGVA